jgi:hypothetical protein
MGMVAMPAPRQQGSFIVIVKVKKINLGYLGDTQGMLGVLAPNLIEFLKFEKSPGGLNCL